MGRGGGVDEQMTTASKGVLGENEAVVVMMNGAAKLRNGYIAKNAPGDAEEFRPGTATSTECDIIFSMWGILSGVIPSFSVSFKSLLVDSTFSKSSSL